MDYFLEVGPTFFPPLEEPGQAAARREKVEGIGEATVMVAPNERSIERKASNYFQTRMDNERCGDM